VVERLNRGEWSEFYAFVKVLSDRKLLAASADLTPIPDIFYPVRKVLRHETGIKRVYSLKRDDKIELSMTDDGQESHFEIDYADVGDLSGPLFERIKMGQGRSFEIDMAEELINSLHCGKVKASSSKKGDIMIVIHDHVTNRENNVEFSIKSYIGGMPTLLNASGATNFKYKLSGFVGALDDINNITGSSKVKDRLNALLVSGVDFELTDMSSQIFKRNLRKIDSSMPLFIGQFLVKFFSGQARTVADLTRLIAEEGTATDSLGEAFNFEDLKYKIKQLLINVALGLVPNTDWDGFIKADGGYIIVKEDGDVVCFHIYNISELGEYLFNNTKLETASTTRHKFASVYEEDGQTYMNLNLQIRFMG